VNIIYINLLTITTQELKSGRYKSMNDNSENYDKIMKEALVVFKLDLTRRSIELKKLTATLSSIIENLQIIKLHLHTIKGSASFFKVQEVAIATINTENCIKTGTFNQQVINQNLKTLFQVIENFTQ
jgi:chemotaxis protein histidine kinase CheA